ncbi:unnamed protein product [Blepharisma stoltei]|uniref:Uncharacterized protein n=1 Tax=Blepharisma stoltei TaxID=1481888 RepID=A0AAU9KC53_9CILI|nr:unnamed protein product [Blepharisma stoltei]
MSINFVLSFITLGVVHIYFAATVSAYKSSLLSELSDPSSCENSETFTSLAMVYHEADSSGCRGDLSQCSCYQQGKCFQGTDKDINTVKKIEKTFKCGGICVYDNPIFYSGKADDSCIDQIHDAVESAGIICCISLALGATFCFLCVFSVCFMAFYKKKPLYTLKPHRNINESSIWELMQSHFTDKTIGTINTRRQFIHESPPSNPSPSPIDVPDDDKTDENILEE